MGCGRVLWSGASSACLRRGSFAAASGVGQTQAAVSSGPSSFSVSPPSSPPMRCLVFAASWEEKE